jgi:uncharacterized protein (DUF1015 family)
MPQIAGFRGALWDAARVDLAKVAAAPIKNAQELVSDRVLVKDPTRAMYLYHQLFTHGGRTVTRATLLAAMRLAPWSEGSVRAHEQTNAQAKQAAIRGIEAAGGYTEAVFAGYRDAAREVDRLMRGVDGGRPVLETTTADGTIHRVWRVASAEIIGKLRTLFAPKKLHVLDGHARYEGMLAYSEKLGADAQPQYSSAKYGLACLVNLEDPALVVAPRHRIVRGESVTQGAVLEAAKTSFIVDKLAGAAKDLARQQAALDDTVAHQPAFVCVFAGEADAWKLTLKPDVSPVGEGVAVHRALQKYDPIALEHMFLARCTKDAATVTERNAAAVHAAVAAGAQLGIIMRPLTLEQVIHADELGALLPFGSTAFTPPLAHLVSLFVDPDEDLV